MRTYVRKVLHYLNKWRTRPTYFTLTSATKLSVGSETTAWSVPAGLEFNCPGATNVCSSKCYAQHGNHLRNNVTEAFARNQAWSEQQEAHNNPYQTARIFSNVIMTRIFRVYESGDFRTQFWVKVWTEVARLLPEVSFWAYTRSFNLDFSELAALPNFSLFASADMQNQQKAKTFADRYNLSIAYGPWDKEARERYVIGTGKPIPKDSFVCPVYTESIEVKGACVKCGLCLHKARLQKRDGTRRNVVFLSQKVKKSELNPFRTEMSLTS